VATSLLTLMAIFRIWVRGFWGEPLEDMIEARDQLRSQGMSGGRLLMTSSTAAMVGIGLALAALSGPLTEFAFTAAEDLLGGGAYGEAVLTGGESWAPTALPHGACWAGCRPCSG